MVAVGGISTRAVAQKVAKDMEGVAGKEKGKGEKDNG
jgi:hypothetical protein